MRRRFKSMFVLGVSLLGVALMTQANDEVRDENSPTIVYRSVNIPDEEWLNDPNLSKTKYIYFRTLDDFKKIPSLPRYYPNLIGENNSKSLYNQDKSEEQIVSFLMGEIEAMDNSDHCELAMKALMDREIISRYGYGFPHNDRYPHYGTMNRIFNDLSLNIRGRVVNSNGEEKEKFLKALEVSNELQDSLAEKMEDTRLRLELAYIRWKNRGLVVNIPLSSELVNDTLGFFYSEVNLNDLFFGVDREWVRRILKSLEFQDSLYHASLGNYDGEPKFYEHHTSTDLVLSQRDYQEWGNGDIEVVSSGKDWVINLNQPLDASKPLNIDVLDPAGRGMGEVRMYVNHENPYQIIIESPAYYNFYKVDEVYSIYVHSEIQEGKMLSSDLLKQFKVYGTYRYIGYPRKSVGGY